MKKFLLFILMTCLFITGCNVTSVEVDDEKTKEISAQKISVSEVKKIVDNYQDNPDYDIIDVREKEEYVEGHIEGAINIPLLYLDQIHISTERKIIVYCQSGRRSKEAAKTLIELGYKNVYDMGGINNWKYKLVEGEEFANLHSDENDVDEDE